MPRIQPLEPPYPPEIQAHFDQVMKGAPPLTLFYDDRFQFEGLDEIQVGFTA